ncbi:MAG: hypothetical protein IJK41_00315 [Muribaculaceae bacterium]|nr:hypothetical protein [Muribaculaceae bacterium]
MSNSRLNDLGNIQSAINTLRRYNKYLLFSVDEKLFEHQLLVDYFENPLDDEIEESVENILCVAAVKTVLDNPNIPEDKKLNIAEKNARDLREAMRYAKLEYHAMVKGTVSVQEYNRRKRAIPLVQLVAKIAVTKKYATELSIIIIIKIIENYSFVLAAGLSICRILWKYLPAEVRNSLLLKSKEICDKAIKTLKNYSQEWRSTPLGKMIGHFVQKIEIKMVPHLRVLWNKAKTKVEQIKDKIKSQVLS